MKIQTTRLTLQKGMSIANKAVASKSTQAVLQCVLIRAEDDITMTGNNTEMGIETTIDGEIEGKGVIAVDAKLLTDIVSKLPDGDVSLETADDVLNIRCGKAKFKIPFRNGEDFPTMPEVDGKHFTMRAGFLKDIVSQVGFAILENSLNKVMEGIYLVAKDNILTATALDGHRIAVRSIVIDDDMEFAAIIPAKSIKEIAKILPDTDINIYVSDKHMSVGFDNTLAVARLIDGQYMDISKLMGSDFATSIKIDRKGYLDSIERACLLTREGDKKPVIAEIKDNVLNVSINVTSGSMNEDLDIVREGEGLRIGFNPRFLIDALNAIEDNEVSIFFGGARSPFVIKDDEDTYKYLILPVNIAEV